MLNTVWLVIAAMAFGAALERAGVLQVLLRGLVGLARGTGSLIAASGGTCFGINVLAADQFMAIVLTGRMFRDEYLRRGLHEKNLARVVEDTGTITSPLVPWNTCGTYMAATLGVPTLAYLPFCFFNLINPLVSMAYGATGFKIEPPTRGRRPPRRPPPLKAQLTRWLCAARAGSRWRSSPADAGKSRKSPFPSTGCESDAGGSRALRLQVVLQVVIDEVGADQQPLPPRCQGGHGVLAHIWA